LNPADGVAAMVERSAVLAVSGLTKRFAGTLALDRVDLAVAAGEIHALVGENGAGKSTLIKILAGVYPADAGEVRLMGRPVDPYAESLPLSVVHQDLGLVDELSIGENVALVAGFPRRRGLIDWSRVWQRAREIYLAMAVEPPDPRLPVGTLSAASKAVLGIARALARRARIVILDEPTAALPSADAAQLFGVLQRLRAAGCSIIYVSHRLDELFGLADRVTVLRDGRRVRTAAIADITPPQLIEDMLGRPLESLHAAHHPQDRPRPLLEVRALCNERVGPVSFHVGAGEIVGLVGLRGAGHEAIGRMIFGSLRPQAGEIRLDGAILPTGEGVRKRIRRGIALLPADRGAESTLPGMSLLENLFPSPVLVGRSAWRPFSPSRQQRQAQYALSRLAVRPRAPTALIDWLSGGNQQKVCVGRWLDVKARLYVMEEPTAGIDVGAKFAIHRLLDDVANNGAGILVISSDFEEVATLCDRALVIGRGLVSGELRGPGLTVDNLIAQASFGAARTAATSGAKGLARE
jgi:ribose transport system ATP-binding protein